MSDYVVVTSTSNTVTVVNKPTTLVIADSAMRGPPGPAGPGANDAYAQANAAYAQANAAYEAANTGGNANVYNQANAAYAQANAAYNAANNASGNYGDANVSLYVLTHDVETKGNLEFIRNEGFGNTPYFGFVNPNSETLKLQTNISAGNLNTDVLSVDRQSQDVNFSGNIITTSVRSGGEYNFLELGFDPALSANGKLLRLRAGDNPDHIHLDTGNNSGYDQFWGDDSKYLKLSKDGAVEIRSYDSNTATGYTWTFANSGVLTSQIGIVETNAVTGLILRSGYDISLVTDNATTPKEWTFLANGDLILQQSGGITGASTIVGDGAHLTLQSGETVTGNGGSLTLKSGQTTTGDAGVVNIRSGDATTGDAGNFDIKAGDTVTGDGGDVTVIAGDTITGNGGSVRIAAGSAINNGPGGSITILSGNNVNQPAGDINLIAGITSSGNSNGGINLSAAGGSLALNDSGLSITSTNVTFTGNLLPNSNNTQSLGSPQNQWADLYVSNNTIYFSNTPLTIDANNNLLLNGSPITDSAYNQANLSYSQANTARTTANDAYGAANTANTNAVNSYNQANTALGTSNNAYAQANTARDIANLAYGAANSAGGTAKITANSASQVSTQNINFVNTSTVTVSVVSGDNGNANVSFTSVGGGSANIAAPNGAILVANALSGANGTNNFVFNVATNFLGVGTNTPNSNITVTGNVWVTTGINVATINIATANVLNVNGRSTLSLGTGTASNGNVTIHANGVEFIRMTNVGRIGFGTTTPNSNIAVIGNVWITTGVNAATVNATTGNINTATMNSATVVTANLTTGNVSGTLYVGTSITTGGSYGDVTGANSVVSNTYISNANIRQSQHMISTVPGNIAVTEGSTVNINNFSGMIIINNWSSGGVQMWLLGGGLVGNVANTLDLTTSNTGSLSYSAPNYVWTAANTATYGFATIKTRDNA